MHTHKPTGERRRHPRVSAQLPISLATGQGSFEVRVKDISRAGACAYAPLPLKEMTQVDVSLCLPGADQTSVRARGVVVRCSDEPVHVEGLPLYELAVFFTDMNAEDSRALDRFVSSHMSIASPR